MVNLFLDEMAKEAKNIITTICDEQCNLNDRLLPKHCAALIAQVVNSKKKKAANHTGTGKRNATASAAANAANANYPLERPGNESYRKTREDLTTMDKLHMALTELSFSLNYTTTINVWEYTFVPREYLNQHLETRQEEQNCLWQERVFVTSQDSGFFFQVLSRLVRHGHVLPGDVRDRQALGAAHIG